MKHNDPCDLEDSGKVTKSESINGLVLSMLTKCLNLKAITINYRKYHVNDVNFETYPFSGFVVAQNEVKVIFFLFQQYADFCFHRCWQQKWGPWWKIVYSLSAKTPHTVHRQWYTSQKESAPVPSFHVLSHSRGILSSSLTDSFPRV